MCGVFEVFKEMSPVFQKAVRLQMSKAQEQKTHLR